MSLDSKSSIVVPEDRFGLHAIDVLDPDMVRYVSWLCITYINTKKALQLNTFLSLLLLNFIWMYVLYS